jgi:hypothetical protein
MGLPFFLCAGSNYNCHSFFYCLVAKLLTPAYNRLHYLFMSAMQLNAEVIPFCLKRLLNSASIRSKKNAEYI